MKPVNAIIFGCWENGYSVIRQLATKKLKLASVYLDKRECYRHSRYLSESWQSPHPLDQSKDFLDFMMSRGPHYRGAILLPTNDNYVEAFARHKNLLSRYYTVLSEDEAVVQRIINKESLYQFAESLDISTPASLNLESMPDLQQLRQKVSFPCILKPHEGHKFFDRYNTKLFLIQSPEELMEKSARVLQDGLKACVQKIIPGPETNLWTYTQYTDQQGTVLYESTQQKIRTDPPYLGVSCSLKVEWNQEVVQLGRTLLQKLGYRGLCSFEFKKCMTTGKWVLLDGNPRLVLFNGIAGKDAINLPYIIYSDLILGVSKPRQIPPSGTYWVNQHIDVRSAFFLKRTERVSMRDFLRPYLKKHYRADWDLLDPLPFLIKIFSFFKAALKKLVPNRSGRYKIAGPITGRPSGKSFKDCQKF